MGMAGRWPPTRAHIIRVNSFPDPSSKDNTERYNLGPVQKQWCTFRLAVSLLPAKQVKAIKNFSKVDGQIKMNSLTGISLDV